MVNARMGVSITAADAEGIEEPKREKSILPVHNKKGIRCVWMFTKQNEHVNHGRAFSGRKAYKSHYEEQKLRRR